jgi:pimeloyl-ACP methyl ester carboxylesterase
LTQLKSALSQYEECGGRVEQYVIADCGHSPFIEKPGEFQQFFFGFLKS